MVDAYSATTKNSSHQGIKPLNPSLFNDLLATFTSDLVNSVDPPSEVNLSLHLGYGMASCWCIHVFSRLQL